MRCVLPLLCLLVLTGCRYIISEPLPAFMHKTIAVEKLPEDVRVAFAAEHHDEHIESVETASFKGRTVQYRIWFRPAHGGVESVVFGPEGRLVASPGVFRPEAGPAANKTQHPADAGHPIRSETNTTSRRLVPVADLQVPPKHSMTKSVTFTLKSDRLARIGEEQFVLPAKSILVGQLSLEPSDGPMGIREYDNPSFLRACFDFEFGGRKMWYSGFVRECGLWAPNGTQTTFENSEFISECGLIDGMMDDREDWFYIRPDGGRHTNRLKYTSCHFELMLKTATVLVKCRYYDQNPNIAGYVTIYYSRDLDELLLLKDAKYSYDQNGNIEDWYPEEGPYVTLVEPGAAPNGGPAKPSGNSGTAEGLHR